MYGQLFFGPRNLLKQVDGRSRVDSKSCKVAGDGWGGEGRVKNQTLAGGKKVKVRHVFRTSSVVLEVVASLSLSGTHARSVARV